MGKRIGKKSFSAFFSSSSSKKAGGGRSSARRLELQRLQPTAPHRNALAKINAVPAAEGPGGGAGAGAGAAAATAGQYGLSVKGAKKKAGARLWMRFDRSGQSEVLELDKSAIIKRAGIPARDLRILGPIFSNSSNILAREKAIIVNLEFIKAIVTAEEVLLLDPLSQEVIPFVEQLRQQLPLKNPFRVHEPDHAAMQNKDNHGTEEQWPKDHELAENQRELPFEFQILEIALEVVCTYLDSNVADLEKVAYPALDELAKNVSTKNLERVRSLKSHITRLLARVQKVRDEIEHLLDDNEDMAHLYLTRNQVHNQQFEALMASAASNNIISSKPNQARFGSNLHGSAISSIYADDNDVEDLEMLLEAYFMQLDGTRNKILSVREYIDDTEDYVNIQLDNKRNELIQLQLVLSMATISISINNYFAGAFAMNLPCQLYSMNHIFTPFVGGTSAGSFVIFLVLLAYGRWKGLLGT